MSNHTINSAASGLASLNLGAPLVGVPQSTGSDGQPKGYMSAISNSTDGPHLAQGQHAHTIGSGEGRYDERSNTSGGGLKGVAANVLHSGENRTGDRYDGDNYSRTGDRYTDNNERSSGGGLKAAAANVLHSDNSSTGDRYDDNSRTGDRYDNDRYDDNTRSHNTSGGGGLKAAAANALHSDNHNNPTLDRHDNRNTVNNSTTSSRFDEGARNSTSGAHGIGGGHGGPTAFESNPEKVGLDRTHDRPDHHTYGDLLNADGTSRSNQGLNSGSHSGEGYRTGAGAAIANATTGGRDHTHGSSNEYDSRSSGSHGGLAAAGAGGLGAGALAGAVGSHSHTSPQEGIVGDSTTGQKHFGPGSSQYTSGSSSGLTGGGSHGHGGGLTGGAAGLGAGAAATGVSPGTLSSGQGHESGHRQKEGGIVGELKQELKDHQKEGGYSDSSKHVETDGPHGLVWHNGKYVHRRELEGKGSTGVPLK